MRNDPGGTGAVPALTSAEILEATRGIESVTGVETEEWGAFPGPHMTVERMWALRNRIAEHLLRPEVTGVVVTHGTDTLEESAYLVARSLPADKPVVFTGAMRTVSDLGWDGPANLLEAVRVAASPETRGYGAMVVISGQIFAALDATKTNTHLAMGRGNVPPAVVPAIHRWIAEEKPVVLTSRTQGGRVGHTYGYAGGGRRLEEIGVIFGGSRRAQQARIDLMLALGAGMKMPAVRAMFRDS